MRDVKHLTVLALLTAASLCVYILEAQLPPLTAIPGIKLGLSNIFTVTVFHLLGPGSALTLLLVRIVLGSIVTGQLSAMAFSLSGGMFAYIILFVLRHIPRHQIWAVSMVSAIFHSFGQILIAAFLLKSFAVFWYLPVLILSSLAAGLFTGLTAQYVLHKLEKNRMF